MWVGFQWIIIPVIYTIAVVAFILRKQRSLLFLLCLIFFLCGIIRYQSTIPQVDGKSLSFYNDRGSVQIEGLVTENADPNDRAAALKIEAARIKIGDSWKDVSGSVLVYASQFPSPEFFPVNMSRDPPYYRYGDIVQVEGELKTPQKFDDFDWQGYLAHQGIYSVINRPDSVKLIDYGKGFAPKYWLSQVRERMSASLASSLHEPQGALAQAMVLGDCSGLPDELKESFARSGTSHLIAISGLNIAIIGGIILIPAIWLFGRTRPYYLIFTLGVIWVYALLTGLNAPVLRAAIMMNLWLVADHIGRPRSAMTSLLFAAAIMVGITPSILSDVSFQLSFAAMAGLIMLTPRFQSLGIKIFRVADEGTMVRKFLVDSIAVTMGAVVATLPIIAFYFDQISIVVLLANIVVLPVIPAVICSSALVSLIGIFLPSVAHVIGWIAWLFISYMIESIEFFASWPLASMRVNFNAVFLWIYYIILFAVLLFISNRRLITALFNTLKVPLAQAPNLARFVPARLIIIALFVITALIWTAAVTMPDSRLHIFFLDVGQGDAILIQRGYHQILVDGGPDEEKLCLELGDKIPFWDRTIEDVILTHPDSDHITGLLQILQRYDVNCVVTSGQPCGSSLCMEWQRIIDVKEVDTIIAEAGQRINIGKDICLEVLHPRADSIMLESNNTNMASVVVRLIYGDFSLLLTGDITEQEERMLLETNCTLDSTALKVSHHGSGESSCSSFLDAVNPQVAVISVGVNNKYGHPDSEVMDRLNAAVGDGSVYVTAEQGTIELITDGRNAWVKTER